MLGWLARNARPILLLDASVLLAGFVLTSFNMLLLGWTVFLIGHVLTIVAFVALAGYFRDRMDGWSWAGLLVLELGFILAVPQLVSIWQSYYQTPTGALMLVPSQVAPIGLFAEGVTWVGLAFYALAARGPRALPSGVAWMFVIASVIGLAAAFFDVWFITAYWWAIAVLFMILGIVAAGANIGQDRQTTVEGAAT